MIEEKCLKPYQVNNFVRIIVSTNEDWAVNAGPHERRFFILDVSGNKTGNKKYFDRLWHQYDNGGREALMYELMHLDYSDIDLRKIPKTEALLEQKIHSLNHLEKWWFEILNRRSIGAYEDGWAKEYGTKEVFNSYLEYASDMRVNYKSISTQVGTFLKRVFPEIKKLKGSYIVYDFLDDEGEKRQGTYYIFPNLKRSRKAFEEYIGQEIKWGEDRD